MSGIQTCRRQKLLRDHAVDGRASHADSGCSYRLSLCFVGSSPSRNFRHPACPGFTGIYILKKDISYIVYQISCIIYQNKQVDTFQSFFSSPVRRSTPQCLGCPQLPHSAATFRARAPGWTAPKPPDSPMVPPGVTCFRASGLYIAPIIGYHYTDACMHAYIHRKQDIIKHNMTQHDII